MICNRCRHNLLSNLQSASKTITHRPTISVSPRFYATSSTPSTSAGRQPSPSSDPSVTTPAAISSSTPGVSQPLSTPDLPSSNPPAAKKSAAKKAVRAPSSCVAGTKLAGLGFTKNKPEVLAKEDDQYPDWLWGVLDNKGKADKIGEIDMTGMNKKARTRAEKKMAAIRANLPKQIPVHEQSIDLTGPGATAQESLQKRQEITASARDARRKGIREDNFLRGL